MSLTKGRFGRFANVQRLLETRNEGLGMFSVLPDDVLFVLLRNLNVAELLKCKRLSWMFYRAALHNRVWEAHVTRLERFYPQIHDLTEQFADQKCDPSSRLMLTIEPTISTRKKQRLRLWTIPNGLWKGVKPLIFHAKAHHHLVFAHLVFGSHICRTSVDNCFELDEELSQLLVRKKQEIGFTRLTDANELNVFFFGTRFGFVVSCENMEFVLSGQSNYIRLSVVSGPTDEVVYQWFETRFAQINNTRFG